MSSRCLVDETRKLTSRRSVLVELGGDEVGHRSGKSSWRKDSVDVENKVPTLRVLVDLYATAGFGSSTTLCGGVFETRLVRSVTPP